MSALYVQLGSYQLLYLAAALVMAAGFMLVAVSDKKPAS
jgi:hypothetical protein